MASCGSPAEPYYSEGKAHHEKGEYEEAIDDCSEAVAWTPTSLRRTSIAAVPLANGTSMSKPLIIAPKLFA